MKTPQQWKSKKWWSHLSEGDRMSHFLGSVKGRPLRESRDVSHDLDDFVDEYEEGASLILSGRAGSGKTTNAIRVVEDLITKQGASARMITADAYVDMIKNSFEEDGDGILSDEYNDPYALKHIRASYDVLLLDDLEGTRKTEFAAHEIGTLIRSRYDAMLTTIITTSLSVTDIKARFGDRLSSPLASFELETL